MTEHEGNWTNGKLKKRDGTKIVAGELWPSNRQEQMIYVLMLIPYHTVGKKKVEYVKEEKKQEEAKEIRGLVDHRLDPMFFNRENLF